MRKFNMKRRKDTHKKKKRKLTNVHCKGVSKFLASSVPLYRLEYEKLEPHPLCYF